MTGLHLPHPHMPHPHLTSRFIGHAVEGFWEGMFHHHRPLPEREVAPARDWDDWHHPDGSGYAADGRNER
ncbi:hypothetical protein [Nocardia sp. NPDC049149]|uniref:hypothetical protein n=1 Tax=Nocardia sp. NPDC049149 TaxID=3364315 RepID=UPI00371F265C